jgi:hypothetical protein
MIVAVKVICGMPDGDETLDSPRSSLPHRFTCVYHAQRMIMRILGPPARK